MNKDDVSILNDLANVIRKHGSISKGMLWKNSKLGIYEYDKIRPYLSVVYEDIRYNRKKQTYTCSLSLSLFTQEIEK